jgi:ABC-type bacteriocin/lantibiotic exporter with double-glycine peptidase domain
VTTLTSYVLRYLRYIVPLALVTLLQALFRFVIPLLVRALLGTLESQPGFADTSEFMYFLLALTFAYVLSVSHHLLLLKFSLSFHCRETRRMFEKLFRASLPFVQKHDPTYFTERIVSGVQHLFAAIGSSLSKAFVATITIAISLGLMFTVSKTIFLLFLIVLPLTVFSYRMLNRTLERKSGRLQKVSATNLKNIINVVQNIEEIKQIANYSAFANRVGDYTRSLQQETNRVARYAETVSLAISFMIDLVRYSVLFLTIVYFLTGSIEVADLVFVNLIFSIYFNAIRDLNRINIGMRDVRAFLAFVRDELLGRQERDAGREPLDGIQKIAFDVREFGYPGGEAVLRGIRMELLRGSRMALVGAAGCGKSTLAKLLLRFHETEGVFIDGRPVDCYPLKSLREKVYVLSQAPMIFPGTIEDNIRLGLEAADESRFHAVVETPFVREFLAEVPEGLAARLGEGAHNLSGGQKQKLVAARMLMHSPEVIILDEATSSMDSCSETLFYECLDERFRDSTVLIISHRLSTVRRAAHVIVLEDGVIAGCGTHDELVRRSASYQRLFDSRIPSDEKRCEE